MTRLRPVSGRTGSHHVLHHVDGRRTVVPVHGSKEVKRGLLKAILRDCRLEWDELEDLL
jgi:predicted RNA binding protein YcfA (HicA-like mRNA interferase family)